MEEWLSNPTCHAFNNFTLILCWGVWLACNSALFHDKHSIPEHSTIEAMAILEHFPQERGVAPPEIVIAENLITPPHGFYLMVHHAITGRTT